MQNTRKNKSYDDSRRSCQKKFQFPMKYGNEEILKSLFLTFLHPQRTMASSCVKRLKLGTRLRWKIEWGRKIEQNSFSNDQKVQFGFRILRRQITAKLEKFNFLIKLCELDHLSTLWSNLLIKKLMSFKLNFFVFIRSKCYYRLIFADKKIQFCARLSGYYWKHDQNMMSTKKNMTEEIDGGNF